MAKRRTTKQPHTGLEQQGDRGREAIGSDLELTEDHEEATEVHPDAGEVDRIVDGDAPGEVRKTHHVSAQSPFPEMAATSCGMHRRRFKCGSFEKMSSGTFEGTRGENNITSQTASGSSLATLLPSWSIPPKDRRCTIVFRSFASVGGRPSFTNRLSSFAGSTCDVAVSVGRKPSLINWLSSSSSLFSQVLHATQHKWR